MGHKKRNPAQRSKQSSPAVNSTNGVVSVENGSSLSLGSSDDLQYDEHSKVQIVVQLDSSIKLECERALNALRRGNHTKALRLMKESSLRYENSGLLFRVQGTICVKVASLIEDPNVKQRHLKNAIESARRAVSLSPNSIEFAHFYANLLYEVANDSKEYEEVVQECEKALSIQNPVDPAKESLQDESEQKLSTPEARITHVQQEIRSLIQKSNIASISTWMKNLGNVNGEEKFRLIPMRRLSEDPMEVRLAQTKRPNEIKKATKTPEERRKEIEVRVAAARLLQQKSDSPPSQNDEDRAPESVSGSHRHGERRKSSHLRKVASSSERMDQVRSYWNSMTLDKKQSLLQVSVDDLRSHFGSSKDGLVSDILSEALSFAEANKTWKFWVCCCCNEKFLGCDTHIQHVVSEHMGSLSPKLQSVLPQEVDSDWVEMLLNGLWKPIDISSALEKLEDEMKCHSPKLVDGSNIDNLHGERKDCVIEDWCSTEAWDSAWDSSPDEGKVRPINEESKVEDNCNGGLTESRSHEDISNFGIVEYNSCRWLKASSTAQSWPLCDDSERVSLLERIRNSFQLLLRHKCLAVSHLNKVIQYTMDELQNLAPGSQLLNIGLDQTPICICFLGDDQLRKVLKFLQDVSHSSGVSRYPEKSSTAEEMHYATQGLEIKEKIALSSDSSCLLLDECLLLGDVRYPDKSSSGSACASTAEHVPISDINDGMPHDSDALLSWIFAGPSSGEQLTSWTRLREEKTNRGLEILQMLEKEFYLLQSLCERKCEHLNYEESLQAVESLCLQELKNREHVAKFISQSYESVLRKRQDELLEKDNDAMLTSSRFELDAISNILKEAQALNSTQFRYEDSLVGVTSRICEMEYGEYDDWRMQDVMHQADTCIEVAIQRQKDQLSVELSKIDARIMRNVLVMQQLELKLGPSSAHDFRAIVFPLVKSFMRGHLEELTDKDASEKSEAAREAFLAELALDAKKGIAKGGDHSKQIQEKLRDKKKNKDFRKAKDLKVNGGNEKLWDHQHTDCEDDLSISSNGQGDSEFIGIANGDAMNQQEEEFRRKIELEEEERKLEETLEYQRRIENEAKQKHLAELHKKVTKTSLDRAACEIVDGSKIVVGANANGMLRNSKQVIFPDGVGSPHGCENIDHHFGSSYAPGPFDNQKIELNKHAQSSRRHEMVLQSKNMTGLCNYNENPHENYYEDPSVVKPILPKILSGVPINGMDRTTLPSKSTSNPASRKINKTVNHSERKVERGLPKDGLLPPDLCARREWNSRNSSMKVREGSSRTPSTELENQELGNFKTIGYVKEKPSTVAQGGLIGGSGNTCSEVDVDHGVRSLRDLHAEEDEEERFQADLKKAVRQSLDTLQLRQYSPAVPAPRVFTPTVSSEGYEFKVSPSEAIVSSLNKRDMLGMGLRNEVGEYNCFLNVIIQSLWHLRQFRDEFLGTSTSLHVHVGDPCVICALYDVFTALSVASTDIQSESVAPTCLRIALSNLYPKSNFFQEAQMNDASEVLSVIFDCLHKSFTSALSEPGAESEESNCIGSWDCSSKSCVAHKLFGMNIFEQMNCYSCGLESRHLKYTSFFHNINASSLRTTKIMCADSSFDELLNIVEMNHQLACDTEAGGCGKLNYIHHILSTPPHVFTIVLGWQNTCESLHDISATLAALTIELDVGVLYRGLDQGNKHRLVSVVCYYGQHYHCFAYSHEQENWIMYDDKTVKVIGLWEDVLIMCERGHLQPQVLFFEAVN